VLGLSVCFQLACVECIKCGNNTDRDDSLYPSESYNESSSLKRECVCVCVCERGGGYYSLHNKGYKCELFCLLEMCVYVCAHLIQVLFSRLDALKS